MSIKVLENDESILVVIPKDILDAVYEYGYPTHISDNPSVKSRHLFYKDFCYYLNREFGEDGESNIHNSIDKTLNDMLEWGSEAFLWDNK